MKFVLLRSSAFIRNARKIVKKQHELAQNVQETLELLCLDPFQPRLRTHKLKGDLKDSYACRVGGDLRIIFKFVQLGLMMKCINAIAEDYKFQQSLNLSFQLPSPILILTRFPTQ